MYNMSKNVIKVTETEFQLDDGSVYSIDPPLDYLPTVAEFQQHYERACNFIRGSEADQGHAEDATVVG